MKPTQTINTVDALWTLIQGQNKSVRKALVKRIIENDVRDASDAEIMRQKECVRRSIERGWKDVKDAIVTGRQLKDADDLLRELEEMA